MCHLRCLLADEFACTSPIKLGRGEFVVCPVRVILPLPALRYNEEGVIYQESQVLLE